MSGAESVVELKTFLGDWRDSMGNNVHVEWARPGSRGGQLSVELSKPRSSRDPIRLDVKSTGRGRFSCGHYDLDVERSHAQRIVWIDCRSRGKISVWERQDSGRATTLPQPAAKGSQDHLDGQNSRGSRDDRKGHSGLGNEAGRVGCSLSDLRESRDLRGGQEFKEPPGPLPFGRRQEDAGRSYFEDRAGASRRWDDSNQLPPSWHGMHPVQLTVDWQRHGAVSPQTGWQPPVAPGAWPPHNTCGPTPGAWVPPVSVPSPAQSLAHYGELLNGAYSGHVASHDHPHASTTESRSEKPNDSVRDSNHKDLSHSQASSDWAPWMSQEPRIHASTRPPESCDKRDAKPPPASVPELADYDRSLLKAAGGSEESVIDAGAESQLQLAEEDATRRVSVSAAGVESTMADTREPSPSGLRAHGQVPGADSATISISAGAADMGPKNPDVPQSAAQGRSLEQELEAAQGRSLDPLLDTLTEDSSEASLDDSAPTLSGLPAEPAEALLSCSPDGPLEVPIQGKAEAPARVITGEVMHCIPLSQDPPLDPRRPAPRAGSDGPRDPRTRPAAQVATAQPSYARSAPPSTDPLEVGASPAPASVQKESSSSSARRASRGPSAAVSVNLSFVDRTEAPPAIPAAPSVGLVRAAFSPVVPTTPAVAPSSPPGVSAALRACASSAVSAAPAGTASAEVAPPTSRPQAQLAPPLSVPPAPAWGSLAVAPRMVPPAAAVSSSMLPASSISPPMTPVLSWLPSGESPAVPDSVQAQDHAQTTAQALVQRTTRPKAPAQAKALVPEQMQAASSRLPQAAALHYNNIPQGSCEKARPTLHPLLERVPVQPPVELPPVALAASQDSQRRLAAYSALLLGRGAEQQTEEEEAPWRLRKRRRSSGMTVEAPAAAPLLASAAPL